MNLPIFKKKISPSEAKSILEEIISEIIKQSGLTLSDLVKVIAEKLGISQIPVNIPEMPDLAKVLAKTFIAGMSNERAYETLKSLKQILDRYKL